MNNSFWRAVGVNPHIGNIEAESLEKAVQIAFSQKKHLVCNSRWFIDIKGKFRLFKFNKITYLAKEITEEKANIEIRNCLIAKKRIDSKRVGKRTIEIVTPQKISAKTKPKQHHLVSRYLGLDLNNNVYSKTPPILTVDECLSMVKLFIENGISYRGFLPRNIVENKNKIYLFDWEDASFSKQASIDSFDHLWKTNFLLNWSYLYGFNDLVHGLQEKLNIHEPLPEPPLVKYEKTYKLITGNNNTESHHLRNTIDEIVFGSELPLKKKYNKFYIRPNDMGHIMADIFPSEIDVLHDMLSVLLRKQNEKIYTLNLQLMTRLLFLYYKEIFVNKSIPKFSLKYYALTPILLILDDYVVKNNYIDILKRETLDSSMDQISKTKPQNSVTYLYLQNKKGLLKLLNKMLRKRVIEACPETQPKKIKINSIAKYILQISKEIYTN